MLMLVASLEKQYYCPRVYVVAETDKMSAKRALTREQEWAAAAAAAPQVGGGTSAKCGASTPALLHS
jgi:hypothetical protein